MFRGIRSRVLASILATVMLVCLAFSYLLYDIQKTEYLEGIDNRLLTGAYMAKAIIGNDYHDLIIDKNSVSQEAYLNTTDTFNQICLRTGIQYLWSNLVLENDEIVFTSATSTSKNSENGDHAGFFDVHSDPNSFQPVLKSGQTTFSSFDNEWGSGRMVLIPSHDNLGRQYVVGASLSTKKLGDRLRQTALNSIMVFIIMSFIGMLISAAIAETISGPIKKLNTVTRDIAAGDYGHKADDISSIWELSTLANNINEMGNAISTRETALVDARDMLMSRVDERTQELTREINERKKAQHDANVLSNAIEQNPFMILVTDSKSIIEYVNPHFTELTGYKPEEAIGETPTILKAGDVPKEFYQELWRGLLNKGEWRGEMNIRAKNGSTFPTMVTISSIRDDEENHTHFVAMYEDLRER